MRFPTEGAGLVLATLLALSTAAPAAAAQFGHQPPHAIVPERDCTCRANGRSYRMGERVCLRAPDGALRTAECRMVQNVTSWAFSQESCGVVSFLPAVAPSRASVGPRS
jgi:hypothetical protein